MKISLTAAAIILILSACVLLDWHVKNWEKQQKVIEWDVHSYYAYLPAYFIYDDIRIEKSDYHFDKDYYYFWPSKTPDGKNIIKTPMGLSFLYAPFFFTAHAYCLITGSPATGFSEPYKVFLMLGSLVYLLIGLIFLKKTLTGYGFSDLQIAITLFLTGLGTNLFCYATLVAAMAHVYNFCLFALFIYFTVKWYREYSIKNTVILGLLLGLITLIRPTNFLIFIFFSFYSVSSFRELKERLFFFRKEFFLLALLFLFAFVVWIPQFLYYKDITGSYFYYSFSGERFYFNNPHILKGLFSFRKGWLTYTPMMCFPLMGLFFMKNNVQKLRVPLILFVVVNTYVAFSWWAWWYGGSYGQRSMIDSYPLMAIPFACLISYISERKLVVKVLFYSLTGFFVWLNLFQTLQFNDMSLHYDGMTRDLYVKQFGKLKLMPNFDFYVETPDYEEAKKGNSCDRKINKKIVYMKAFNNKFLSAQKSVSNVIFANRDDAHEWETFYLFFTDSNKCRISAYDGHYLSGEFNQKNEITFSRDYVGSWETFTYFDLGHHLAALKAANGKYLSVDEKSGQLFASADAIGRDEKFELITAGD